jgi:DNA-binding NarL/FixJ family response regulator
MVDLRREGQVLVLMTDGLSNLAIATDLLVTERTVEAHTKPIFREVRT